MIRPAECACIVSPICFSAPTLRLFRPMRIPPRSFSTTLPFAPRLPAVHHVENVSILILWSQFLPLRYALLCAAPSTLRRTSALCASITRRPFFGPFPSTTRRPRVLHPPLRRFFIHSSEFPPASGPAFSICFDPFLYIISSTREAGSLSATSKREGPSIKIGVEIRCAWLMERENYGGNNRTATEEVAHRMTRRISKARTKALRQCYWTQRIHNSTRSGEP
jgi:hypothetical protein